MYFGDPNAWFMIYFGRCRALSNTGLSIHPGTGVDGFSGWKLKRAGFLLNHV